MVYIFSAGHGSGCEQISPCVNRHHELMLVVGESQSLATVLEFRNYLLQYPNLPLWEQGLPGLRLESSGQIYPPRGQTAAVFHHRAGEGPQSPELCFYQISICMVYGLLMT